MARRQPKPKVAPVVIDQDPGWRRIVTVLERALELREPDALERISTALAREHEAARRARAMGDQLIDVAEAVGHTGTGDAARDRAAFQLAAAVRHQAHADELRALMRGKAARTWMPRPDHADVGPTPEASLRPGARDPIRALHDHGSLDGAQKGAADEIARIFEIVARQAMGGGGMPTSAGRPPKGLRPPPPPMSDHDAVLFSTVYRPWTERARSAGHNMDACIDVIVFRRSVEATGLRWGMGRRRFVASISGALSLYLDMRRKVKL